MIVVSFDEKLQRGCNYCANSSKTKGYILIRKQVVM